MFLSELSGGTPPDNSIAARRAMTAISRWRPCGLHTRREDLPISAIISISPATAISTVAVPSTRSVHMQPGGTTGASASVMKAASMRREPLPTPVPTPRNVRCSTCSAAPAGLSGGEDSGTLPTESLHPQGLPLLRRQGGVCGIGRGSVKKIDSGV